MTASHSRDGGTGAASIFASMRSIREALGFIGARLAAYRALQKKHEAILSNYQPTVIRTTTVKKSAVPIWTRIRIEAETRQTAETLCSRLRAAGETCLIQRN